MCDTLKNIMSNIIYNLSSIYERMWDFMSSNDYVLTDSTQAGIEASTSMLIRDFYLISQVN